MTGKKMLPILVSMPKVTTDTDNHLESEDNHPGRCPDFAKLAGEFSTDESLVVQVIECFSGRLSEFAKYYCLDENLGMDAFQEAMVTTLTKLDTYRGDGPIEAWLRKIVVSACSRLRRGRKNSPAFNVPLKEEKPGKSAADPDPGQEFRLMMAQGLSQLHSEIDRLDEPNRTLLVMHDIDETPIADLAAHFDMTEEAVKSRLKRSRATVRKNLLDL